MPYFNNLKTPLRYRVKSPLGGLPLLMKCWDTVPIFAPYCNPSLAEVHEREIAKGNWERDR